MHLLVGIVHLAEPLEVIHRPLNLFMATVLVDHLTTRAVTWKGLFDEVKGVPAWHYDSRPSTDNLLTLLLQQASLLSFSWLLVPKPILIILALTLGVLLDFIEFLPQLPVLISTGHVIILMIFLGVFDIRGLNSHDHAAPLVHQFLGDTHNFGNTSFLARVCLDSFAEDPGAFQVFRLNLQVIEAGKDLLNYHLIGIGPVRQRLDPFAHHLAPSIIQEVVLDCNPAQLFRYFF